MNENADSSVFDPETSSLCRKRKKSEFITQQTLQLALDEQRKKVLNNSKTLYKYQFQYLHKALQKIFYIFNYKFK